MEKANVCEQNTEFNSRTCKKIIIDGCRVKLNFCNDPNENVIKNMRSILFGSFANNAKDDKSCIHMLDR